MTELPDFLDENYNPQTVMARVGHLPERAQCDIEKISRIMRGAFGFNASLMPDAGRIVSIKLIGPCADLIAVGEAITGYDFHVTVNLPECADDRYWSFARRLIASEIGAEHPVTLVVDTQCNPAGIILYDAAVDVPLNAREMPLNP